MEKVNNGYLVSEGELVQLLDILKEWGKYRGWTNRPDCKNWKKDIDARENRRESIVYGNCLRQIKSWIGRKIVYLIERKPEIAAIEDLDRPQTPPTPTIDETIAYLQRMKEEGVPGDQPIECDRPFFFDYSWTKPGYIYLNIKDETDE